MEPGKIYHMHIDIRGVLQWPLKKLTGMFRNNETGKLLNPQQAKEFLMDQLEQGRKVLPCSKDCEGFDYITGCPGHHKQ